MNDFRLSVTNGFDGGEVHALAWSPDGTLLAVAHSDDDPGGISLFDTASWTRRACFDVADAVGLTFSLDGRTLIASNPKGLFLVDLATGQSRLLAAVERVLSIALSPDGRLLAASSRWGEVTLCEVATGNTRALAPEPNEEAVRCVAFSRDGATLCAGSDASAILRWDVASGVAKEPLLGQKGLIMTVAFSPDGLLMASSSFEGTTGLWDVSTWTLIGTLRSGNIVVPCVSFSPDGRTLVTTEAYGATIWDVASQRELAKLSTINVGSVGVTGLTQWSPDGRTLASRQPMGVVTLHDLVDHSDRVLGAHAIPASAVAFGHDGRLLDVGFEDGVVRRWDLAKGSIVQRFDGHAGRVKSIHPALGDRALVVLCESFDVRVWDLRAGTSRELVGHSARVRGGAVSPDGRTLATAWDDGAIRLWGLEDESKRVLFGHECQVDSVAWSDDGSTLYSGSSDGTYRAWDLSSGESSELGESSSLPDLIAASPAGGLLAVAMQQNVRLLSKPFVAVVAELRASDGDIVCLAFSPDGSMFAFGSAGGALRVYDVATGALRETGRMHANGVASLSFSPGGEQLASAAGDGTVRLWRPATLEPLIALRAVEPDASYAFTEGPHGRVEIFGEAARACVRAARGPFHFPIDIADADFVVAGLVRARLGL